jgi:chromosome segregation ATPase
MKPKDLRKKIKRLEKRLQEAPKKLSKLKRKLDAAEAAKSRKSAKKSAARARAAAKSSKSIQKKSRAQKRKLNLSPERRAQLAAAMKARWVAKRAAEGKTASGDNQHSPPGPPPQSPGNRPDGV